MPLPGEAYWPETEAIAVSATLHVRMFNNALRAFSEERLTFAQFRLALSRLAPEVFELGQRLVAVNPPRSAMAVHPLLVEAVDLLVLSGREARLVAEDGDPQHVAAIAVFLPEAQARLASFSASLPASAGATAVHQEVEQLGKGRTVAEADRTFVVTLGPFASTADARQAVASLAFDGELAIPQSPPYIVTAGSYAARWEAEQAANATRVTGVPARVEAQYVYDFHSEVEQPPSGYYWREMLWLQALSFPGSLVDTAADGSFILVASRDGAVQGWRGSGEYLWHQELNAALVSLDVAANGNRAVLSGYESFLLSPEPRVVWRSLIPNESTILTQALVADDGNHVALRSEPSSGAGTVHALDARTYLWPTQDYIGARDIALTPDGSKVAIASAKDRVNYFILVSIPQGGRLQRFELPSVPDQVALTATASHAAILSGQEVLFYRLQDESLLWRHPVPGKLMTLTPDGQLLITAGQRGLTATSRSGNQLWLRGDVQVSKLVVNHQYVVAQTDRERLHVFALDGAPLGAVYTPGRLLSFALARDSGLLVATDDELNMIAWQLP
ncbi:MAG: hypothetical protein CL878_08275 [Dehalococcoidia bacterium]|nr:hypothetical protein [Dehalococcoidia bacterium]